VSDTTYNFLRRAAQHPDAIAIITPAGTLTYGEVAAQVDLLSEQISALTPPGTLVALEGSSPLSGIRSLLAAGAARRALLPLDLTYPRARREAVLHDARPALLLRENEDLELVPAGLPAGLVPRTGMQGVAYVMYTSGSTGRPKGVVVPHENLFLRTAGMAQRPGLAEGESILALAALSFDACLSELLIPLHVGGAVIAPGPEARNDPDLFAEVVERFQPDVVQATPSFWRLVTAAGWRGLSHGRIWCGGEAMTRPLAELLLPKAKELWNVYGPTENTVWSTAQLITDPAAIGLGEPVPGTGIHLEPDPDVDAAGDLVGEILLYGVGVATGYLDREDLTATRFVEREVADGIRRCYRTGDLARRRADGILEFMGRIDQQVKIRGHRVETGDIEAAFESHKAVREVVVVFMPDDDARSRPAELVASVVTDQKSQVTGRDLRRWVVDRLPKALVPTRILIEAELPRTPSGKIDRLAQLDRVIRETRGLHRDRELSLLTE
jgi:amino acid adenylation domain-containing protein